MEDTKMMEYTKMIDGFVEGQPIEGAARYLYTQVKGGFISQKEAKQQLREFISVYAMIIERPSRVENHLDAFDNLFSDDESIKEFAHKFYGIA